MSKSYATCPHKINFPFVHVELNQRQIIPQIYSQFCDRLRGMDYGRCDERNCINPKSKVFPIN
jgi:hypothetical protein